MNSLTNGDPPGDDPQAMLGLLENERVRAVQALEPDPRLIYGSWGAAWAVGFLLMWSAARDAPLDLPLGVAGALFAACLLSAVVATITSSGAPPGSAASPAGWARCTAGRGSWPSPASPSS
jgi:hypothetical protein